MPSSRFKNTLAGISWFKDFALPILVTMVGVYLGLWASEWEENQKDRQTRLQIFEQIGREVTENKSSLVLSYRYHHQLHDSLRAWNQVGLPMPERYRRGQALFRGLNTPFFQEAAFTSLVNSEGSRLLTYELSLDINRVYAMQRRLDGINQLFLGHLIAQFVDGGEETDARVYRILSVYLNDALNSEETLVQQYRRLQTQLKSAR